MVNEHVANRVSVPQIEFLAQCMEQFPALALAHFGKSREETNCAHKKWIQIGSAMNKIKPGVTKTGLGWLRYWTNYKYQLRKRYPQFKQSWVNDEPVRVTPLERRFLQVLCDHEKIQPPHVMFQGDQTTESYPTEYEEEKDVLTTNYPQNPSQSMPTKQMSQPSQTMQEMSQPMPTMREMSQSMPTMREMSQSMPTMREMSEPMPTMRVVDVSRERNLESPGIQDDDEDCTPDDDKNSTEDCIETVNKSNQIKSIQVEILKFNLKRQKEMHDLEMEQMKERHRLEMEILQLKKIRLMQDCDRIRETMSKS